MSEVASAQLLSRETFLAEIVEGLAAVLESGLGPEIALSCMNDIGLAVGVRVDRDFKRTLGIDGNLTPSEFHYLVEDLIVKLYLDSRVIEASDDRICFEALGSAFGQVMVSGRDLSEIGTSIFGAIAAVNFGYGKVCSTVADISEGQTARRVVIFTSDTSEARAAHGEEFYREVVQAFANVKIQLQVVEENRVIRKQLEESAADYLTRNRQISAIAAVATTVSQSLDPSEILTSGLKMLLDAVGVEVGAIFTVNRDVARLDLSHHTGISADMANEALFNHILPPHAPPGKERWEAILSTRRHSPPDWSFGEFQCYASAPMRAKERPLGAVLLLARLRRAFTSLEMELLELVASELGVGLENIRLYDYLAKQVRRFSDLREISAVLNRCNQLEEVLDFAAESVTQKLGFDRVGIFLLNQAEGYLEQKRGTDEHGQLIRTDGFRVPVRPEGGTLARAVMERAPLHVPNLENEPGIELDQEEAAGLASLRISAFARVPLIAEDQIVGAISVDNMFQRRPITFDDLNMLMIFGNQVAVAIDNARFTEALQRSAEELRKVDAVRSQFVSMISHELRSPLHKIRNAAAILNEDEDDPQRLKYGRTIIRSADYLAGLVNNLLTQSRIEQSALRISPRPEVLVRVVREAVQELRAAVLQADQSVVVDIPDDIVVMTEASYLKLILMNLLTNASRASSPKGQIEVRASRVVGAAEICVKDHGVGISPERINNIFERFVSFAPEQDPSVRRGIGLGLHICRSLVEAHGGQLRVSSEQGVGSEFSFTIPLG